VPESGDSIQAMKAGLMEVGDLFVVNKSDRPGADRLAREVQLMIRLRSGDVMRNIPAHHGVDLARLRARRAQNAAIADATASVADAGAEIASWSIPVLQTVAETGQGVAELRDTLDQHWSWL